MKNSNLKLLWIEIEAEIQNLRKIVQETQIFLNELEGEPSIIEVRGIGSIVHDFYCCVEKIFKRVVTTMDEDMPSERSWHIDLLIRMTLDIPDIRPKVISTPLKEELREYLQFRHVFRNIYGFELKWAVILPLIENIENIFLSIQKELTEFILFLKSIENLNVDDTSLS